MLGAFKLRFKKIPWAKTAIGVILGLLFVVDSYAIYQVYVQHLDRKLDYYPFWAGGQQVILHRQNPYSPDVMLEIQQSIYGRPALPEENQHGYAYPAYAPFNTLPFVLLPFPISASVWIASQQVFVIAAVILTIHAVGWPIERWSLLLLCLVAMTFRYSMITFVLGQTSIWVLFSLAVALWAAQRRHGLLAGLALAAGMLKPQLVVLPALAMLTSLRPPERKRTFLALAGAMLLLVACSLLFIGPWIPDYLQLLGAYQDYSPTRFPILALANEWLAQPLSQILNAAAIAALLGGLAAVLWRWRGSGRAALPFALTIVATQLVVPQTGSYNLVLLLLPATVILAFWSRRPQNRGAVAVLSQGLVWATLLLVPWLLWPIVQKGEGSPWDLVIVPVLLLVAAPWRELMNPGHRPTES